MTILHINYYKNSTMKGKEPIFLGCELSVDISEVLLPDCRDSGPAVSLTKFFDGQDCHRWKVTKVDHTDLTSMKIFLDPRDGSKNEEFLRQTRKNNQKITGHLRRGTLVEVDFGYIPITIRASGERKSNKRYPDTIGLGEMHKRRLCIVISAYSSRIQVVPITSKAPSAGDRSIFQLSDEALKNLTDYNSTDVSSYALCSMIETVSTARVLPPRAYEKNIGWNNRNNSYHCRLPKQDQNLLIESLSHAVGLGDYQKTKNVLSSQYLELQQVKATNQSELKKNHELEAELEVLKDSQSSFDAMREVMIEWHMNLGQSLETATAAVDEKVADMREVLDDV